MSAVESLRARTERYLSAMPAGMRVTSGQIAVALGCSQSAASGVLRHLAVTGVLVDDGSASMSVGGAGKFGKLRIFRTTERVA